MSLPRLLMFSSLLAAFALPAPAADGAVKTVVPPDDLQVVHADADGVPVTTIFLDAKQAGMHGRVPKTSSTICYALREYKFTSVPETNALKAAGESTCEDAAQFQVKNAISIPGH